MSDSFIKRDPTNIPVYGECEVVVIGGGVAGIGAALAAARNGKKVTLIEKAFVLGGLATLGHVCIYLPLDDGLGHKVFSGIAEELLYTTIKYGYNNLAEGWTMGIDSLENPAGRYRTHFNIPACILAFDELMKQENITVLFDTVFSEPIMEGDICKGVILETKQGRVAYMAKMIIDASGDADVLYRAGAECCELDNNIISHWTYELDFKTMQEGIDSGDMLKAISLKWLGLRPDVDNSKSTLQRFPGTTIEGVNGYVRVSRELALDHLKKNQRSDYSMMTLPFMPQFRMTRRIKGLKTFKMTADVHINDSVGIVCFCLANPAPVYEFPYGGVIDSRIKNIAAAGRIVGAQDEGWELMRTIPACVFTGQVAGTAASMATDNSTSLQEVNVADLQKKLAAANVTIHIPEKMKGNKSKKSSSNH